ncbi:MAG: hypothetical protein MUE90_09975, partial [Thermoanaerobaculales bacterium]|nr:hypothetical protein [Thermoanaerobaculales bacterium]
MKRASVVLLTVAVAAAGALLLVGRRAGAPVAATGATAPRHHWIVRATEVPDAILCDFVNTEERLATTRMWLNEPWPCS